MTVIFGNHLDIDCQILTNLWQGLNIDNFIEVRASDDESDDNWYQRAKQAVMAEDDTLIIAGHGTSYGLLFPLFSKNAYVIDASIVECIHAKRVICCFCHASSFCQNYDVKAFATSMFISNVREAVSNGFDNVSQDHINAIAEKFYIEINELITNNTPMEQWPLILGAKTDIEDGVDTFNRQGIYLNI